MATIDDVMDKLDDVLDKIADVIEKLDTYSLNLHLVCPVCQGTGEVNESTEGQPGPPYQCPRCGGDGTISGGVANKVEEVGE